MFSTVSRRLGLLEEDALSLIPGAKLSPRPESQMTRDFAFLAGLA